jgi:predicted esterase
MIVNTKRINVSKTARYYILGAPTKKINSVWIVLHGYGQLAENFIEYFKPVANETTLVVAPEALNRFYLNGFSGKTGSTWMTKEDRENEIKDYVEYLDSVYNEVVKYGLLGKAKITLLGFSQGAATASRWLSLGKSKIDRLILWGGFVPDDVNSEPAINILSFVKPLMVLGDKDEFISEDNLQKEVQRLNKIKLSHEVFCYEGKHEIKAEILRQII